MTRPHWKTIGVRRGARRLTGASRLVVLLRWQSGQLLEDVVFIDTAHDDRELAGNPTAVDCTLFPVQEALDALDASAGSR